MKLIDLKRSRQYLGTRNPRDLTIPATLGTASGSLYVYQDDESYVYARLEDGIEISVLDLRVPPKLDLKVLLGYDGQLPEIQVINVQSTQSGTRQPLVGAHHTTHEWPNNDAVWVRGQQFMPGLLVPVSGWTVRLYEQYVRTDSGTIRAVTEDIDLSDSVPANGARWVLIGYDGDGNIDITEGSEVEAIELLTDNNMPAFPEGVYVRWAVKVSSALDGPRFGPNYNDMIDLRWAGSIPGSSGVSDHNDLTGLQGGTTDEYYHLTEDEHTSMVISLVDTEAVILGTTPTRPQIAFGTDTEFFYLWDGSSWRRGSLKLYTDSANKDIGPLQNNSKDGYYATFITNKYLYNIILRGYDGSPEEGAFRVNITNSPKTLEIYLDSSWRTIIHDLTMDDGFLAHYPFSPTQAIRVYDGSSVDVGLNGRPMIYQYQKSMGPNPPPQIISGGTF